MSKASQSYSDDPVTFAHKRIRNVAGAVFRVAKAVTRHQRVLVSAEEQIRRQSICNICKFFIGTSCAKCFCVIKFKSMLKTEHCPINKW